MYKLAEYEKILEVKDIGNISPIFEEPWPPLPGKVMPPSFPLSALPETGRNMVEAVAEFNQVNADMPACLYLGALSTCIVGRGQVTLKDGYEEPLLLYLAVSANPSERKSSTSKLMLSPVYAYEAEQSKKQNRLLLEARAKLGVKRKLLSQAENSGKEERAIELTAEIEELESMQAFELIKSEGTTEAIAACMARNGGRLALVSSEGDFINIIAGAYSSGGGVYMEPVLKGYSGEPMQGVRIGRKVKAIDKAFLSVTLTVQPGILDKLTQSNDLTSNGVVSRFLYSMPASPIGSRSSDSASVPPAIVSAYEDSLSRILSMSHVDMRLTLEAWEVRCKWHDTIEPMLAPGGALDGVGDGWGGKIVGNTVRIAGLLAMADGCFKTVEASHMKRAVLIGEYFVAQARHIFGADTPFSANAAELVRFLHQWGKSEYKPSDLRQKLKNRKRFEETATIDRALRELIEAGIIREILPTTSAATGRPPQNTHRVHPELLKRGILEEIAI